MSINTARSQLRLEIEDFLYAEAAVLDRSDYTTWVEEFITTDIRYQVPIQVTRERSHVSSGQQMYHIDEGWSVLNLRARRLNTAYAWAEDPPSRTRHVVTNVRVTEHPDQSDQVHVESNLLLYRNRGDIARHDLLSAERRDTLRRQDERWRLAHRVVILDQSVVATHNLSVLF